MRVCYKLYESILIQFIIIFGIELFRINMSYDYIVKKRKYLDYQWLESEGSRESHIGSQKSILRATHNRVNFLPEFIQNAEDARSTHCELQIFDDVNFCEGWG